MSDENVAGPSRPHRRVAPVDYSGMDEEDSVSDAARWKRTQREREHGDLPKRIAFLLRYLFLVQYSTNATAERKRLERDRKSGLASPGLES